MQHTPANVERFERRSVTHHSIKISEVDQDHKRGRVFRPVVLPAPGNHARKNHVSPITRILENQNLITSEGFGYQVSRRVGTTIGSIGRKSQRSICIKVEVTPTGDCLELVS